MNGNTEIFITFPVTIMSIIFTVINIVITIYLIRSFFFHHCNKVSVRKESSADNAPTQPDNAPTQPNNAHAHSNKQHASSHNTHEHSNKKHSPENNKSTPPISFYKYTSIIAVLFNTLCSFFNTIFCLYLILDPEFDDEIGVYVHHPSHNHRILSTVCWYIAQIMVILVFSGRLYYTFEGSTFAIKKKFIIYINVFNIITVFSGLICGYYGVFAKSLILAEIGLNLIGRILYEIISFIVLYMFSKRLLALTIINESVKKLGSMNRSTTTITTSTNTSTPQTKTDSKSTPKINLPELTKKPSLSVKSDPSLSINLVCNENQKQNVVRQTKTETTKVKQIKYITNHSEQKKKSEINDQRVFLAVTTRNAILMLTVSFSVVFVIFCFFGFRFIFGTQSRLTLLIPMNMAAFDSINTSICILCLFRYGTKLYYVLCGQCDLQCKQMCLQIARKYC